MINVTCELKPWISSILIHNIVDINLGSNAVFTVSIFSDNNLIGTLPIVMDGLAYENWNSSDLPYVSDFILDQLGCVEIQDGY